MQTTSLTVGEVVERAAQKWPDREAVVTDDRRLTYSQLNSLVNRLANGLVQLGVTQNDRVAVMLPNSPEFACAYYALAKLGVVIVPMNTRFRRREVDHIITQTEACVLIIPDQFLGFDYVDLLETLRPGLPSLRHIVVNGEKLSSDMISFDHLLALGNEREPRELGSIGVPAINDVLAICYTSGTTGQAKGAVLTHEVPLISGTVYNEVMEATEDDTILITLAVSQIPVFGAFVLASALAGMRAVLLPRFKPDAALELVEKEKVTYLIGVPTMWVQELAQLYVTEYDLSSLRVGFSAGATCPPDVARAVEERMDLRLHIAYGMTETSGYGTMMRAEDGVQKRFTTVGRPLPGMAVKIVDEDREPVPIGQPGEVAV